MRVAIQALSAVAGGAQSLHTNGFDEALALPTEHAARIALRTQQILQNEAGTTDTADPLGGAYFIEAVTEELEQRALELIDRVDELGGAVAADRERAGCKEAIEDTAYRYTTKVRTASTSSSGVCRRVSRGAGHRRAAPAQQRMSSSRHRSRRAAGTVRAKRSAATAGAALAEVRPVQPARRPTCRSGGSTSTLRRSERSPDVLLRDESGGILPEARSASSAWVISRQER